MERELVTSNGERERAANQHCSHTAGSSCGSEGTPFWLPPAPWPSQGVGVALPLQQLTKDLEEGARELNQNLTCSGMSRDLASQNWGDTGERGLRAFPNRRLSGAVAQGREIMAEFNE